VLRSKWEFELWRQGCRGPGRIPTELWVLAAEASAELDVEETARQLQVNAERLEEWVAQLGLLGGPKAANGSAATEVVELSPMPQGPPGECRVEVEEPSQWNLCISLKGPAVAPLASLPHVRDAKIGGVRRVSPSARAFTGLVLDAGDSGGRNNDEIHSDRSQPGSDGRS
jgi:hypothetical protein